jgi:hypothetical protein
MDVQNRDFSPPKYFSKQHIVMQNAVVRLEFRQIHSRKIVGTYDSTSD